ncbi:MAG: hypothetical protein AB1814_01925 [Thermodesulfobacteriota bacterium]
MADLRIQYDEEMVGAGHPTKDDTLNRLVLAEHNNDGTHKAEAAESMGINDAGLLSAYNGLFLSYYDATHLTVHGGVVLIQGVPYALAGALQYAPGPNGAPGDNNWWYCTVTPPAGGGTTLTDAEFSGSTTSPTYDETLGYWYIGSAATRVIGFCKTVSGYIQAFAMNGRWWTPMDAWWDWYTGSSSPGTWNQGLSAPNFQNHQIAVMLHCYLQYGGGTAELRVTPAGASLSDANLTRTAWNQAAGQAHYTRKLCHTNVSAQVQINIAVAGAAAGVATIGIMLPRGI